MKSFPKESISSKFSSRAGFTVIELLVAAAITIMLAGILLAMTSGVLRAWNRTSGSLSVNSEAQLIFDVLKEDLQSAVYRNDFGVWMAVEILDKTNSVTGRDWTLTSESGNLKPDAMISERLQDPSGDELPLSETRYGLGGTWLRFFTAGNGEPPQAIAYQLARRKITGDPTLNANLAETRYMLYRSTITPEMTLQRGFNLNTNPFPAAAREPKPGYTTAGNPLISPRSGEVIGTDVIDFGIRLYWTPNSNLVPLFPINSSGEWAFQKEYFAYGSASNPFPDAVDVMIRILTPEGARMLQNLEEGMIPPEGGLFDEAWWNIATEHSRVFTQRIHLKTRPL